MFTKYDKNKMNNRIKLTNNLLILLSLFYLPIVKSSGLFELDIIKYENYNFNESIYLSSANQHLSLWNNLINWSSNNQSNHLNSNLIYNLCLKESKAYVLGKPCTFGEIQSSVKLPNQPVNLKELFTFRWTKSITLILTIMKLDEKTGELKQIDKHVHFDSNLLPINNNLIQLNDDQQTWQYKLSINSYSRLLFRFRITCSINYYGEDCSRFCRERDDLFGHYQCNKDGKQICLNGWYGEQCDIPICSMNCSQLNGYCKKPNECLCKPGYRGLDCTECIPHQNCLNGFCELPNQCICKSNWGGLFCDIDLNYCSNHQPCLNDGQCVSLTESNQYKCLCKKGFNGTNCEQIYDICLTKPCLNNGKCLISSSTNTINKIEFKCICETNWTGERCETNINECISFNNPCGQNGECIDVIEGYQCRCKNGWTGLNCSENINECNQLNNNEYCVQENTEKCIDTIGSFKCLCKIGFTGKYCQLNIDDCTNNPCLNQGECLDLVNDYKCLCKKGFKGKNCDQFDDNICNNLNNDDMKIYFKINQTMNLRLENDYWPIQSDLTKLTMNLNDQEKCKSKWCTCSNSMNSTSFEIRSNKTREKNLICICINETEYAQLNRKQLNKLNLILNPTIDQLMLVDNQNYEQQNYLLDKLKIKKQILSDISKQQREELNQYSNSNELISEILIDNNLDLEDDLFVSLTLNFNSTLNTNQIDSICSSMIAIYSLICNQPYLDQLNFVCKLKNRSPTRLRFLSLDNDERILKIANIIEKQINNRLDYRLNYRLKSILKRTYQLTNNQLTRWQSHCLIVLNLCFIIWLIVIIIMIFILLSNDNEQLKIRISENRLLNLISLQLNRKVYRKTELNLNNRIIHNKLKNNNLIDNCLNNQLNKIKFENNYIINNEFNSIKQTKLEQINQIDNNLLNNYKKEYKKEYRKDNLIENQNNYKLINNQLKVKLTDNQDLIKSSSDKILNKADHKIIKPVHL